MRDPAALGRSWWSAAGRTSAPLAGPAERRAAPPIDRTAASSTGPLLRLRPLRRQAQQQGPSGEYPLGTDQLGRDYLSRLIYGARISLFVGLAATTLHVVVAVLIGGTAGFIGGKLDLLVQRFVDAWMSFPGLLLLLTIMSIAGQVLLQIIVILGLSSGITNSRVVRGAVIGIKENDSSRPRRRSASGPPGPCGATCCPTSWHRSS